MQEKDITTISSTSSFFPEDFNRVTPKLDRFYAIGNTSLLTQGPRISIVGSRRPTNYGKQVTRDFAQVAARAGITVVSGLAFGVDSIAHEATLDCGGKTIAVLPTGLRSVYPACHTGLAYRIVKQGGLLISEYNTEAPSMKHYFVLRNRLIAALSETTLVTEAAEGSGSLHTAEFAGELGKNVCAVPGSIFSSLSVGVHKLLKEGAEPLVSTSDLLTILGVNENLMKPRYSAQNKYELVILDSLEKQNLSGETLLLASELEVSAFHTHLTMLEIKGAIEQTASGSWRLAK